MSLSLSDCATYDYMINVWIKMKQFFYQYHKASGVDLCNSHDVQELWFQMKMNNLKHSGSKEDDQEMATKRKAMVLSFQPVSLTFDYVNYHVEMHAWNPSLDVVE
ncbi:hypothetical protein HanPSC8_Chr17g0785901 [Helianthus annuus]|nr:hypothetical protein HanPSC8_Chr17g0785901 [Helianthus annuus]